MKIPELDAKLNAENQKKAKLALSQIPRFIEELNQVKDYLEEALEVSKENPDRVIKTIGSCRQAILKSRLSLLSNLPLGIIKPAKFTTPEPLFFSDMVGK